MANAPELTLEYGKKGCPDCGQRVVEASPPLPDVGDDFNWLGRDFDAIRQLMLEDLAARYPEKTRFTPADLEVVITEVMAAVLDQISDMADRVAVEAFLETARHPASVRRLLSFIGVNAGKDAVLAGELDLKVFLETARQPAFVRQLLKLIGVNAAEDAILAGDLNAALAGTGEEDAALEAFWLEKPSAMETAIEAFWLEDPQDMKEALKNFWENNPPAMATTLEAFWLKNPLAMERAREAGPRQVQVNHRMVTLADYKERLEDHPLVLMAHASTFWNGSWPQIEVALIFIRPEMSLDALLPKATADDDLLESYKQSNSFADDEEYRAPKIKETVGVQNALTPRMIIRPYLDAYRMVGQAVRLRDAVPVGIVIIASLVIHANYHASEIKHEAEQLMTSQPGGLFAPGNFAFGQDLFANDFLSALAAIPGVAQVCLIRFKRVGAQYPDRADSGRITLHGLEVAMCENNFSSPEFGYSQVRVKGGRSA